MIKIGSCVVLDRLQLVKTEDSKDFEFRKVMLCHFSLFSRKLIPYDIDNGKQIIEMKHFIEEDKEYKLVDINSFKIAPFTRFSKYYFDIVNDEE